MAASSRFFLLSLNNQLMIIPQVPSESGGPQIYDTFAQIWTPSKAYFPEKVKFHMHFEIGFNRHVLVGRYLSGKVRKPVNVFIYFRDDTVHTNFTTRSIYSPLLGRIVASSRNSLFIIDQRLTSRPDRHFRIDFKEQNTLSLHHWSANRLLLDLFQTCPASVTLNQSSLVSASVPSLFSSFSVSNYSRIKELFTEREFNNIRLVSSLPTQRSLQIGLPGLEFGLIPNLSELFNFSNANLITLSNGLVFLSGGHQKSSFKAINNCCLLKVSDAHDRPKPANSGDRQVPSMLLVSKDNLATVENLTSPKKTPDWSEFFEIRDFLLDPSTPVVVPE